MEARTVIIVVDTDAVAFSHDEAHMLVDAGWLSVNTVRHEHAERLKMVAIEYTQKIADVLASISLARRLAAKPRLQWWVVK